MICASIEVRPWVRLRQHWFEYWCHPRKILLGLLELTLGLFGELQPQHCVVLTFSLKRLVEHVRELKHSRKNWSRKFGSTFLDCLSLGSCLCRAKVHRAEAVLLRDNAKSLHAILRRRMSRRNLVDDTLVGIARLRTLESGFGCQLDRQFVRLLIVPKQLIFEQLFLDKFANALSDLRDCVCLQHPIE